MGPSKPLPQVLIFTTKSPVVQKSVQRCSDRKVVGLANHTVLRGKDGVNRIIDDSAAPIKILKVTF